MKLKVAMIPANVAGVMFYRMYQYAEAMKRNGEADVVLFDYSPNMWYVHPWQITATTDESVRYCIDVMCREADIVIWQSLRTTMGMSIYGDMRAKYKKPFLVEIDDYIINVPKINMGSTQYYPGSGMVQIALQQMRQSDGIIVSTPYLGELYREFNPSIYVMENGIDFSLWGSFSPNPHREEVRIGWAGGASHNQDLASVKDVIHYILNKYENTKFYCIHGCPDFFKNHPKIVNVLEFRPIDKYPEWLKSFNLDIGIAPLIDNNFNRGKSNLRWLEYSAMGIPTVASNIQHFRETIKDGKTGLLANNHGEWIGHLSYLTENEKARKKLGKKAYKYIKKHFNAGKQYRKYLNVLKEKVNEFRRT